VGEILLIRHGQTEWSANGRHTSVTDLPLLPEGEIQAGALRHMLGDRLAAFGPVAAVFASPRQRALRPAELAGLSITAVDPDLAEWAYGEY